MINIKTSSNLLSIFAYLVPIALLTGPFLPDLFVSLTAIIFILIQLILKEKKYFNNYIIFFLLSFYFFCIISSLISESIFFSLKSSFVYFRFIIFSLAIWYLIENNKNFIKYFSYILITTMIIGFLTGYYQYFYSETILGKEVVGNRLYLIFSDNLILGQLLSRLFPLSIALIMLRKKYSIKIYLLLFFLFIATDTVIYLSGERTALGLIILSSFLMLLFINKLRLFRFFTLTTSIIIIIIISLLNPSIKERNIDQTFNQMGLSNSNSKIYLFSSQHEDLFKTSLNMYLKNPILGIGANNYRNECDKIIYNNGKNTCNTHPHNNYFQIAAELGSIGILFLLIALGYFTKVLIFHFFSFLNINNDKKLSNYQVCLVICLISTLWPILPNLNFFNNYINVIYYLPLGFYMHSIYSSRN